jgi:glucosamine--fructose-6-phosphate aminotransferase (isomerizing)
MCGIVGILGRSGEAAPRLIEALRRLEYRGYDSAGVATLRNGSIDRRRAEGKLGNLEALLNKSPIAGATGIGHTRWATHGAPNETNAHPIATDKVAVVHNGIIENFAELRDELTAKGATFTTDTDTESVAHLLTLYMNDGLSPQQAMEQAMPRLKGAFALACVFAGHSDLMIGARRGAPLAVGYGEGEMYLASDALAMAGLTDKIAYPEDGDWVELSPTGAVIHDEAGRRVNRAITTAHLSGALIGKGNFRHYMLKEIYDQPSVLGDTIRQLINPTTLEVSLPQLPVDFATVSRLTISACGTAFYAGLVGKYWFERIARLPVEADVASEFRYREAPMAEGGAALFISQSGETADTLAALKYARSQKQTILSVVNVPMSSIARGSDAAIPTLAGPEIGVASTKAFTTQLTVLACLSVAAARARGAIDAKTERHLVAALMEVPARAAEVLNHDQRIQDLAKSVAEARDVLYLGRGTGYPIALEGALKLKEISYIHAEGYAAGEMKHGPIALIDEGVPIIVIAPSDSLFEKTASNMQEVLARGGRVIFLSDKKGITALGGKASFTIELPEVDPFVAPILYAIPVQLLAYHVAVAKGTDVDQPRNLAKSVTVE